MKRKIFIFVIALSLVFVQSTNCFAVTKVRYTEEIPLNTLNTTCEQEMWHYSGGYWLVNAGTDYEVKVTDLELAGALNISEYLKSNYVLLKIKLPMQVIDTLNYGDYVAFNPVTYRLPLSDLFIESSFYGYMENDYLYLYAKPILKLFGTRTFDEYITKLNVTLPLIDYTYGNNLYSIYKNATLVGGAKGAYNTTETSRNIISPYIHPYLIKNNTGVLRETYQISINDKRASYPNGHYVGWGTFKNGGAVGCRFIYPIGVEFTAFHESWYYDYSDEIPDEPVVPPDPPVIVDPPDDSGETTDEDDNKEGETTDVVSPWWRIHRTRNNL